jgi:hypothetical protein
MRLACAFLLATAFASGQVQLGHGVISGSVIDQSDHQPVRKAVVTLTLQGMPRMTATDRTDGSGRFRFDGLPPGNYSVSASKGQEGHAVYGADDALATADVISLAEGEMKDGVNLRFVHPGAITGHVYDAQGDPLVGVTVSLLRATRSFGERVPAPANNAQTDDRGEYRMPTVEAGQYYLRAEPNRRIGVKTAPLPQYFGGAEEFRDAAAIGVRDGERLTSMDFSLREGQMTEVAGRIAGVPPMPEVPSRNAAQNAPMIGRPGQSFVQLTLSAAGATIGRSNNGIGTGPPDYKFSFGDVVQGRYILEARLKLDGKTWAASLPVDATQPVNDLVLALSPVNDLKGTLRFEGELPAGAGKPGISLMRAGSRMENIQAHIEADGSFVVPQVAPGEWQMNVGQLPRGAYLKSASLGTRDVRFSLLTVDPVSNVPLNIVISMGTAKIEGQVDAGSGDPKRAGIVVAPVGPLHNLARFYYGGVADETGKIHMQDLAPGRYKVFALEKLAPVNFRTPEAVEQLDSLGDEIDLKEGGSLEVHPKLIPTERAREALPAALRR